MNFAGYAEVWRVPAIRQALVLGALGKAPWFGASLILTLHVVGPLGQSYSAAGVVAAVFTLAAALASPLRGRLLDRVGLRRTLLPSLLILPPLVVVAPFVPLVVLVPVMGVVGFFAVPWFVLTRQMVIAAAPLERRRTALALDSMVTELAFMAGPPLGILASVYGDTRWALPAFSLLSLAAALLLWRWNPRLVSEDAVPVVGAERQPWLSVPVVGLFLLYLAIAFVLGGQDMAIIAGVRQLDAEALLAVAIVAWSAGSLVGGMLYGGLHDRRVSPLLLAVLLAVTTVPAAWASNVWMLCVLLAVTGLFCAPSLAAAVEALSHAVPESRRGEAMGWQGTFSTVGNALSPPAIGFVIDGMGWRAGFGWTAVLGGLAIVVAAAALALGRRRALTGVQAS